MTPEMYQAATATLFGSDGMRLAGIAAQQGATGFDTMLTAVNREGAAAEVAAAKTQGLPGALSAVQNSAETAALKVFDLVDGPLTSMEIRRSRTSSPTAQTSSSARCTIGRYSRP